MPIILSFCFGKITEELEGNNDEKDQDGNGMYG